jgi:hypothetical protein
VRIAPLLLALGLGLAVGGGAAVDAAARSSVRPAPEVLEVTIHPGAPSGLAGALMVPLAIGTGASAVVLAVGVGALRRSTDRAGHEPARGGWRLGTAAAVGAAALIGVAVVASLPVRWRWVAWGWSAVGALALPLGIGLLVLGLAAAAAGRRRGRPVGLWDLVPAAGPQARVQPMARWLAARTPGVEPWSPDRTPPSG